MPAGVEGQAGRHLHQQAAEAVAQIGRRVEEDIDFPADLMQPPDMGDFPGQLDRKTE
jgi:hypothetical protein